MDSSEPVSQAIRRFQESKTRQEQAEYYRKHRLSAICRRESRIARAKSSTNQKNERRSTHRVEKWLVNRPSTIVEVTSDPNKAGLATPPSSKGKPESAELLRTPLPKVRMPKMKKTKRYYGGYNGNLGWSSPPQQEYDPQEEDGNWGVQDVEVGDVPSSVLRGVQGLWALGC